MSSRRTKARAWWFAALSIPAHVVIILLFTLTPLGNGCTTVSAYPTLVALFGGPESNATPIEVSMIEPRVLNPFAERPTPEQELKLAELKIEEAKKPEEQRDLSGQVVDVAKPNVEIRPDDSAKFLAEYDNKVDKETKGKPGLEEAGARKTGGSTRQPQQASAASPPRQAVRPQAPQAPSRGDNGAGSKGALAMRSSRPVPEDARGKEGGLSASSPDGTEARQGESPTERSDQGGAPGQNQEGIQGREGQEGAPGTPDSLPQVGDLRPSDDLVAQAVGVGSSDYLKDVDEGADTLLNTKRWKYASFFTRVKRGVAQSWRPDQAYRLRDPTGQIYGHKNRFTVLKVSLKPDGTLGDVMVEKGCGVDFLDDEAITAFREAQPFPNPPPGLVDPESKLITFRFGFYFEISGSPTFRIFRQ